MCVCIEIHFVVSALLEKYLLKRQMINHEQESDSLMSFPRAKRKSLPDVFRFLMDNTLIAFSLSSRAEF